MSFAFRLFASAVVFSSAVLASAGSSSPSRQAGPPPASASGPGGGPPPTVSGWTAPAPSPPASLPPAPGPGPAAGGGDAYAAARQLCVDESNRYRATLNLPPLRRSADLERCADTAARADHASQRPHGHFSATRGCGIAFAENEIPWWSREFAGSVEGTVRQGLAQMWAEGPGGGHYENLRGDYTEVGCGFFEGDGKITVVQDLR